jgi:beta-N-acetylhexosaminidase
MNERTRAGQLFMVGVTANGLDPNTAAVIQREAPGGIYFMGHGTGGVAGTSQIVTSAQRSGTVAAQGVPLLVGVDQEGGQIQVLTGPGFATMPSAAVQGQWNPSQLRTAASTWGQELRAAGVNLDLAPVGDVLSPTLGKENAPIGQSDRSFSTVPSVAATHVAAFVSGMQSAGVATTVKHFPGLGRVLKDTDTSANVVDNQTTPNDPALSPYAAGVRAGTTFMMTSSATYTKIDPENRAAFSPTVVQGLMRKNLGFHGPIISDDMGVAVEVASVPVGQRAISFLNAGGDIILTAAPQTVAPMIDAVVAQSHQDPHFASLVASAEHLVLQTKAARGLLTCTG